MPAGRPLKIVADPEIVDALAERIAEGMPMKHACEAVGFGVSTFTKMMALAKEPGAAPEIVAFSARVKSARAEGMRSNLATIHAAKADNWQAAAWLLERCWPDLFSRRTITEIPGLTQIHSPFVEMLRAHTNGGGGNGKPLHTGGEPLGRLARRAPGPQGD